MGTPRSSYEQTEEAELMEDGMDAETASFPDRAFSVDSELRARLKSYPSEMAECVMSCGWRWLVLDEERVMEAVLLFLIVKDVNEVLSVRWFSNCQR